MGILTFGSSLSLSIMYAVSANNEQGVPSNDSNEQKKDTTVIPSFPVKNIVANSVEDVNRVYPMDLATPSNVSTTVTYDPIKGIYVYRTMVGDMEISTPIELNSAEYQDYTLKEEMNSFWRTKSQESQASFDKKFDITDIKFSLGPAEKIFGPGGVQVRTQGSAEITLGVKSSKVDNPSLSERLRTSTTFDFDQKIQLNVNGKVGDKINFGLNYNTEASFDFDQQMLKLSYEGKEDEIIKKIEAGNVSLPLNSSLIKGSQALFGVKTELQFGKLNIVAVASQQQSQSSSVSTQGGAQLTQYEVAIDSYDENRHFFLGHHFYDTYDNSMSKLPYVASGIKINRIEVWVTNKRGDFDNARNIVGFADLAEVESSKMNNPMLWYNPAISSKNNHNGANRLYAEINTHESLRDIQLFNQTITGLYPSLVGGVDYEKVESARRLESSEYNFNPELGFISLRSQLNSDEVLAVAYEYTMGGQVYQVGEFSTDGSTGTSTTENKSSSRTLFVKLLKSTLADPTVPLWKLMMKNVYSLGATSLTSDKFKLDIQYRNDSTGVYVNYLTEGAIKNKLLLKVMNLDRLDSRQEARPDGKFDYVENYTVQSSNGRIIFPVVEPFGSHLRKSIGNDAIADKYVFQELYDSTLVVAKEYTEKNKFRLKGEYSGTNGSEIRLNAMNVPRGSVVVTAGGQTLTENVDYTVDYIMGTVTILNQSILASGTNVNVSLENSDLFNLQRRSLVGTHLEYAFTKDISLGATIMNLSETPLVTKTQMGSEPLNNTIWGMNFAIKQDLPWLTKAVDWLPGINATAPSTLAFNGEFAHLIPSHTKIKNNPGYAYLDDFESSQTGIDLRFELYWSLASTPTGRFSEGSKMNDVSYGYNRSLISWYSIDNSVFNRNNSTTPDHIRRDKDLLSNHLTREVREQEIFPNREAIAGQSSYLPVLNVSYYPQDRGPYNLDVQGTNPATGKLLNPKTRWGGLMRKLETTDFEVANVEYISFWLMDPFVNDKAGTHSGGKLYFNLGDVSEDVLKDGKKFFENGMPTNGDTLQTESTNWGRVPRKQSMVLAFDNDQNGREFQDVGFNGLRTVDEFEFRSYKDFVESLRAHLSPAVWESMSQDPFSPRNDPASDNYHYYRGADYDASEASILERYKRYNGPEGNSPAVIEAGGYSTAASTIPNVEDINQDNTLNELEKYYEYEVNLTRSDLVVGQNNIYDKVVANVTLANGETSEVSWYHFKIPIREYNSKVGSIRDFRSIRFLRLYMTDFEEETHIRFGTFELLRGDWRKYSKELTTGTVSTVGTIDVTAVSIEENSRKEPVGYVLPPGVTRETDPSQPQLRQQNEQSLALVVKNLDKGDARAVYKNIGYDMRNYSRIQLFTHIEKLIEDQGTLRDGEMSVFIRMGTDLQSNYYEYEVPMIVTPPGTYSNSPEVVWNPNNMIDFHLKKLTQVKLNRNKISGSNSLILSERYIEKDSDTPQNNIIVVGNPNLADISSVMIGVRNNSNQVKSAEVWVNELRLTDYNEDGGWGATGNLAVGLSDVGSINVSGRYESSGFGGIEDNIAQRNMEDLSQMSFSTAFEFGRFFPEKINVKIPLFFSYSIDQSTPKYNPLDKDVLLSDALANLTTERERDSLKSLSNTKVINKSVNLTNVKVDYRVKKTPRLYDPANFAVSFAYSELNELDPETQRNSSQMWRGAFNYNFSTSPTPWEPLKNNSKLSNPWAKIVKDFNLNYMPSTLAFAVNVNRLYTETQLRDLTGGMQLDIYDANNPLLSSSKDFTWDRQFEFRWDITRSLKVSFRSATNSRFDETMYAPVNKAFFPDEYENWKDTVLASVKNLGRPLAYQQQFTTSWAIPINKIPIFDWVTANAQYNASYKWDRSAQLYDGSSIGNIVSNQTTWQADGQMNFETLYNKSSYLKAVNQKFNSNTTRTTNSRRFTPKTYSGFVKAKRGEKQIVKHDLGSKDIAVTIKDKKGKDLPVVFKAIDETSVEVSSRVNLDSVNVVVKTTPPQEKSGKLAADYSVRVLMLVRRLSVSYKESYGMTLPGFQPDGTLFGQQNVGGVIAPGLDFAFGIPTRAYIDKAIEKGWVTINDSIINDAKISKTTDIDIKLNLEPIAGLKVDLTVKRMQTDQSTVQLVEGMPTSFSGTFRMTHVAVGTIFAGRGNSANNYLSQTFELFKSNRGAMLNRLQGDYANAKYPTTGFIPANLQGQQYNAANGSYSENSADILIPAFLAAYTGQNINKVDKSPFPSILSALALPNWRITYDGLGKIKAVQKIFKSISLNHAYQCTYNVGSYSSYMNYVETDDGFGFVREVTNGNPIPSSQYDVSSVSINESFAPFLSVDAALVNSFTAKVEYRKQRNLTLNITSAQLIEATNDEWVFGVGYILKDFDTVLKLKSNTTKRVKNDLTTRLDFSFKDITTLIRKLDTEDVQPTTGAKTVTVKLTADYVFSSKLNLRFFCDIMTNNPLISTSYPITNTNVGMSIKFMLTR